MISADTATRESSASEPDSEEDDAAVRQMEQLIAAEDAARAGGRHAAALKAPAAGRRAGKPALQLEDVTILRDQLHVADLEAVARQEDSYSSAGGGIYCIDHTALRNCVVMLQLISAQRLRSRLELRGLGQGNSLAIGRLLLTFTFTIITSSYF